MLCVVSAAGALQRPPAPRGARGGRAVTRCQALPSLRPGETPEQAAARRQRESARVQERTKVRVHAARLRRRPARLAPQPWRGRVLTRAGQRTTLPQVVQSRSQLDAAFALAGEDEVRRTRRHGARSVPRRRLWHHAARDRG